MRTPKEVNVNGDNKKESECIEVMNSAVEWGAVRRTVSPSRMGRPCNPNCGCSTIQEGEVAQILHITQIYIFNNITFLHRLRRRTDSLSFRLPSLWLGFMISRLLESSIQVRSSGSLVPDQITSHHIYRRSRGHSSR